MIVSNEFTIVNLMSMEDILLTAVIVSKFAKVKGDMIVFENISRKKNKKFFNEMERILNEYQREHSK